MQLFDKQGYVIDQTPTCLVWDFFFKDVTCITTLYKVHSTDLLEAIVCSML